MAKYSVTRSCGHSEVVELFGREKERQWRLQNVETQKLCRECYRAQLNAKNAEAAREAEEMGLPALTGTEKQVSWAEKIRLDAYNRFMKLAEESEEPPVRALEIMDHLLKTRSKASWWIDHRSIASSDQLLIEILRTLVLEVDKAKREAEPSAINLKAEATVRPTSPVTETVAEIRPTEAAVEISFPEWREDFRGIVKLQLRMGWCDKARCWRRKISYRTGSAADRAAEAGHLLLAAGIPIRIYDPEIRQKAIDGDYERECRRWVVAMISGKYKEWFGISWEREDDFYQAARKLPSSRWHNPFVVVPAEHFDAILDFAEQYGFQLSPGAQKLLAQAQEARENALIADVTAPERPRSVVTTEKPPKLEAPEVVEIDETLRDDD
jgi:hypothetical protein